MNLLNPTYTIEDQTEFNLRGVKRFIEKCARVCYKSESKITDDSYDKFVDNLINKGHMRPLEFGTVYLFIPTGFVENYKHIIEFYEHNQWSRIVKDCDGYYITTNYRVIIENKKQQHLKFLCYPTQHHTRRHTVHFLITRGCMDEFRTHVTLSHLGESTRYCNYTNGRFGGVTYIIPQWCQNTVPCEGITTSEDLKKYIQEHECSPEEIIFLKTMLIDETSYNTLISLGKIPQETREVLPLCTKSELLSCGFEDSWENFFYRRAALDAQKESQVVTNKLMQDFVQNKWIGDKTSSENVQA